MIIFSMELSVVPEKQSEFLQSCHALVERVRQDRDAGWSGTRKRQ